MDKSVQSEEGASPLYDPLPLRTASQDPQLLILQSCSEPEEPVHCTLIKSSLRPDLKNEALSYTWGAATDQKTITVNGSTLSVGRNLLDALCHLRGSEPPTIWIDAI